MPTRPTVKVFGIGFQKTGTTTLKAALQTLGYRVQGGGRSLIDPITRGDFAPVFRMVEAHDAFEDHPWPQVYREVDRQFPGSKFILTIRDEDKWLRSVVNHLGFFSHPMQVFTYGAGYPVGHEDLYLQKYREHNREVLHYFRSRPADLLVIDWSKDGGWETLCRFLGRDIPSVAFPHSNQGRYGIAKRLLWSTGGGVIRFFKAEQKPSAPTGC